MKWSIFLLYISLIYSISCVKWVSKETGCNDDGDGSKQTPYCTLNKALENLDQDGTVRIQNGEYHEDIVIPDVPELSLIGYGSFMPTFHNIKTNNNGQTLKLNLEFIHFKSSGTQIDLTDSIIDSLNMNWVMATKTDNNNNSPSVIIKDSHNITISNSHFTTEVSNSSVIEISTSTTQYNYQLNITNSTFSIDQLSIKNLLSISISNSLINTNKFNINGKDIYVNHNIIHINRLFKIFEYITAEVNYNRILDTELIINADTKDGNLSTFRCNNNIFESDSKIIFEERNNQSTNQRFISLSNNVFPITENYVIQNNQLDTAVNAHSNYFGSDDGPTICSNPWGDGSLISLRVDYSNWCLTDSCNLTSDTPKLLNSTLFYECRYYKNGTYASLIIFTILYILLGIGALSIYYRYVVIKKENDITDKIRSHSILSLVLAVLQIPFPVTAKSISLTCETLTPAYDCIFTINDSALASLMIYTYSIVILTSSILVVIVKTSYITRYSVYATFLFSKVLLSLIPFITIIYIIICFVYYLSSIVMLLGITILALCIVTEVTLSIKLYKLRSRLKPLKINLTGVDTKPLLDSESNSQVNEETSDEYSLITMERFTSYFKKYIIITTIIQIVFIAFTIWFITQNKPAGILTLLSWVIVVFNSIIGSLLVRRRKAKISVHMIHSFLSIISVGFVSLLHIYYLIDMLLFITSHIVIYFIAYSSLFVLVLCTMNLEFSWTYRKSLFENNNNVEEAKDDNIEEEIS